MRSLLHTARRRAPYLYWKARNKAALLQWMGLRLRPKILKNLTKDLYDDTFWDFHRGGDWNGFAELILAQFSPRSVIDIGCGQGNLIESLKSIDAKLRVCGIDGSPHAVARVKSKALDVVELDITLQNRKTIRDMVSSLGTFDLAICLEAAEHIPAWHTRKLMDLLTSYDLIVFSAAHPNQGGVLHVNEQPKSYWIKRFKQHGFVLAEGDERFRKAVTGLTLPSWYQENIMVFARSQ